MLTLKEKIAKNYINAVGWHDKQKYVLIESDDWGAIRMPSKEVLNTLMDNHIPVDQLHIDKYDSVESEEDLIALFNTLQKFKDIKGNHPVVTAYYVVANPNFEKIEAAQRKEYHFETILDTYNRSEHTKKVPELIKIGMDKKLFIPQYHGREHIHVKRWMEAINSKSQKEQIAFENRAIISTNSTTDANPFTKNYFAGHDYSSEDEFKDLEGINKDGLDLFEQIFGFKSISFTAQGGFWGDYILKTLSENGVQLVGGQQQFPNLKGGHKIINKYWGHKNKFNQVYWRRNCRFEPARNQEVDWVASCLEEMKVAFRWGKPAVISSHRENFTGSIFEENRGESLKKLETLLAETLRRWPDIQFISTPQLAELMLAEK
ncbi:hypothetical protein [Kaistella sp.]|uniref:hypothetical protein n=1 Tax=Kaistella sp. TaxID=2782235 RepID=UPI003C5088FB